MEIKVRNMISNSTGREIPNQFIIETEIDANSGNSIQYFQSYKTIIAKRDKFRPDEKQRQVWLDANSWNYSTTTGKYRNIFLGETKKETEKKIKSGEYKLINLN